MKLEMLGHANLLFRTQAGSILFDPLFYGRHHEGVYDIYPPRRFELGGLPHFDAVVLSHAHADHFDLPSVNLLPRRVPVLLPDDGEMIACVRGLGFTQVAILRDFEAIELGELTIVPTPAAPGAIEHGFILVHDGVTAWNMIDTFPSEAAIDMVLDQYGPIDLLISPWQPLHDSAVSNGGVPEFPHAMYSRILTMIAQIRPRVLVPGACGFSAVGPAEWTNKLLFPLTRERFIADLERLDPELAARTQILEPGDGLTVTRAGVAFDASLLSYVESTQPYDWRARAFRPLELVGPAVVEHRGEAASIRECGEAIRTLFEEALPAFVADHFKAFRWHRDWQPVRQYEVVFDGGERRHWTASFTSEGLEVREGESPLRSAFTTISAGLLIGLFGGALSWDYAEMSGEMRRFDFTYGVDSRGLRLPHSVNLHDPLAQMLGSPSEHEQYRSNLVEALANEYQKAMANSGETSSDPSWTLDSPGAGAIIDPTAIATSVMKSLGISTVDMPEGNV